VNSEPDDPAIDRVPTDLLETAACALSKNLCDHCLGRLFAKLGFGLGNEERGRALRVVLAMVGEREDESTPFISREILERLPVHKEDIQESGREPAPDTPASSWNEPSSPSFNRAWMEEVSEGGKCWLCEDVFHSLDELASVVLDEASRWEFSTFSVGCRMDPRTVEREQLLWQECGGVSPEPIKEELNREIGKRVFERLDGVEFDRADPDITFVLDPLYRSITCQVKPVFILGRYRKLVRGIPQTRWPCRHCRGKGCDRCGGTGRMYETSVEEQIGKHVVKILEGEDFKLHGMGREDVDVMTLGTGRPFILEVRRPRKRTFSPVDLEKVINEGSGEMVSVHSLRRASRKEVPLIKGAPSLKRYRALISSTSSLDEEKVKYNISLLAKSPIEQRTPVRVAHRRADKVRRKWVHEASVEVLSDGKAVIELLTDGGLYIKELLHGDGGRTEPSLSSLMEIPIEVETLDVMGVLFEDEMGTKEGVESHGKKVQGHNGKHQTDAQKEAQE